MENTNTIDFLADAEAGTGQSEGELKRLTNQIDQFMELEKSMKEKEKELKNLKRDHERMAKVTIPDMMFEVGLKDFATSSGYKVTVSQFLDASIPTLHSIDSCRSREDRDELERRREDALDWIKGNNGAAIIKNVISIEVSDYSQEDVETLLEHVRELEFQYLNGETVHPQTLKKFLKEKLENGISVPEKAFKVFKGNKVSVK